MANCSNCDYALDATEDEYAKYFYCKNCGKSYKESKATKVVGDYPKKDDKEKKG